MIDRIIPIRAFEHIKKPIINHHFSNHQFFQFFPIINHHFLRVITFFNNLVPPNESAFSNHPAHKHAYTTTTYHNNNLSRTSMEYHSSDLNVLREWRESCPALRDLWREDDPGGWQGVTWSAGRVVVIHLSDISDFDVEIEGEIPKDLGKLSALKELVLDRQGLTGTIPKELGALTNLTSLSLHYNELEGEIPKELGNLVLLRSLFLDGNGQLEGEIPKEIGKLKNLGVLCLGLNRLDGGIPEELGNLTALVELELQDNRLTGEIPMALIKCTNLFTLDLKANSFSGKIPLELYNLPNQIFLNDEHQPEEPHRVRHM